MPWNLPRKKSEMTRFWARQFSRCLPRTPCWTQGQCTTSTQPQKSVESLKWLRLAWMGIRCTPPSDSIYHKTTLEVESAPSSTSKSRSTCRIATARASLTNMGE
jgi:hypothetical protein